jgi:hypothetical protein
MDLSKSNQQLPEQRQASQRELENQQRKRRTTERRQMPHREGK